VPKRQPCGLSIGKKGLGKLKPSQRCQKRPYSRVEEGRGGLGRPESLRFPFLLIEPDVRISRARLCESEDEKHFPSITATSAYG